MRVDVAVSVIAMLLIAGTACSGSEPRRDVDEMFEDRLTGYIEQAESAGASGAQIAMLKEARRAGVVPFDGYSQAVDRALRCLRDAGFEPHDNGISEVDGYPRREFGVPVAAEQVPGAVRELWPGSDIEEHRCFIEHSSWVQFAYDEQPSSILAREAQFEGQGEQG